MDQYTIKMGKPKKTKKSRGDDNLSDDEGIVSLEGSNSQATEEQEQVSNKKNKKGRKKKDNDWEDEVNKDLEELSLQNAKQLSDDDEDVREIQKKSKKKTKGGKKAQNESDDDVKVTNSAFSMLSVEDSDNDLSDIEIQPKQNKKKQTKKEKNIANAFDAFNNSDEDDE